MHAPDDINKPFLFAVEDSFFLAGRGSVATGLIERGIIKVGDEVEIIGLATTARAVVTGAVMFRKEIDQAKAGDNVGLVVHDIQRGNIQRGQVLAQPGSIAAHTRFECRVHLLSKEKDLGGRNTPLFSRQKVQFYFRTIDIMGSVTLREGVEMIVPGDDAELLVELAAPIALEALTAFVLREHGQTIGTGVVTRLVE